MSRRSLLRAGNEANCMLVQITVAREEGDRVVLLLDTVQIHIRCKGIKGESLAVVVRVEQSEPLEAQPPLIKRILQRPPARLEGHRAICRGPLLVFALLAADFRVIVHPNISGGDTLVIVFNTAELTVNRLVCARRQNLCWSN